MTKQLVSVKRLVAWVFFLFALSGFFTNIFPAGATFYVSPTGSDNNDGATATTSWNTLEKARNYIRSNNLNKTATGHIIVYLRGGTYMRDSTFTLTSADSGPSGSYMVYRAYPGETPIIDGGKPITGWTQVAGQPYYVANIPVSAGFASYFRQLYVNNVRAQRAGNSAAGQLVE